MSDSRIAETAPAAYGATEVMKPPMSKSTAEVLAPFVAELLGTFVLVFTVGCCVLSPGSSEWSSMAVASSLMIMVYGTASVSGGHLNPAVSLSLALARALEWRTMLKYWVVQVVGGIAAASAACSLFSPRSVSIQPVAPFTWGYAMLAEVIYTFMLCLIVNSCAASKRNNSRADGNQFFGLAIGFVVIAGGYAVGNISGACFNPAVALGLASTGGGMKWGFAWTAAEFIGALLAALVYRVLRSEEYTLPEDGLRDFAPRLRVRCASEFLGTFMLVLTVGLNVTAASPAVAFSAAAALTCMIYALGDISAHFNPAVTLAVVLSGRDRCAPGDGAAYALAQLLGGTSAGVLYAAFHAAGPHSVTTFGLARAGHGPAAAGVAELIFTFMLAYAVLANATATPPASWRTRRSAYAALAIGSCVTAGGVAVGSVSGAALNPAVSLGVAAANLKHHGLAIPPPIESYLRLSLWELAGGLLASVAFKMTHRAEYKTALPK